MGRLGRVLRWLVRGRHAGWRSRLLRRLRRPAAEGPSTPRPAEAPRSSAPGVDVCAVEALPPGEIAEFVVEGTPVAVANVEGTFHAVSNTCPHAGGPIGDGVLEGAEVACPLHGWRFDVRTGACAHVPSARLTVHAARVVDGRVRVELSGDSPEVPPDV